MYLQISLMLLVLIQIKTNLIVNGNFENHPPIANFSIFMQNGRPLYFIFVTDMVSYSWYDRYGIQFEFKSLYTSASTFLIVADLCSHYKRTMLCQNINLFQSDYEINFDICFNANITSSMYFSVFVGNLALFNNSLLNVNGCFHKKKRFFIDSEQNTSLCFNGYDALQPVTCNHGPLVDNITLEKIQKINTTISLQIVYNKQINPKIKISTDLQLTDSTEPFTLQTMKSIFQNFTIRSVSKTVVLTEDQNRFLEINFDHNPNQKLSELQVNFNSIQINYNVYNFISVPVNSSEINTDLNGTQYEIVYWLYQIHKPIAQRLQQSVQIGRILGLGYLIFDVFAFWQIAIFHNYLFIKTPYFVKLFAEKNFKQFMSSGIFGPLQLNDKIYNSFTLPVSQKLPSSIDNWDYFQELGFTSNFYVNNIECIMFLLIGLSKSGIMQIIYKITGWKYFNMKKHWFSNFTFDVISWAPFLILPSMIMFKKQNYRNPIEKINAILNILVLFFCFIMPFLFLVHMFSVISTSKEKGVTSRKKRTMKRQVLCTFLDLIFVVTLTMLTCLSIKEAFIVAVYIFVLIKLIYIIRLRTHYTKLQFFFKLFTQIIWLVYTSIFLIFRVLEILAENGVISFVDQFWIEWQKYMGIISIFVFLIGGWMEIIHMFYIVVKDIIQALRTFFKYLLFKLQSKKIHDEHNTTINVSKNSQQNKYEKNSIQSQTKNKTVQICQQKSMNERSDINIQAVSINSCKQSIENNNVQQIKITINSVIKSHQQNENLTKSAKTCLRKPKKQQILLPNQLLIKYNPSAINNRKTTFLDMKI